MTEPETSYRDGPQLCLIMVKWLSGPPGLAVGPRPSKQPQLEAPSFHTRELTTVLNDDDSRQQTANTCSSRPSDVPRRAYPGRMIPQALPPIWEPMLMAEEVRRVAEKGCHAVTFSENPTKLGYPSLHDPHWDPF